MLTDELRALRPVNYQLWGDPRTAPYASWKDPNASQGAVPTLLPFTMPPPSERNPYKGDWDDAWGPLLPGDYGCFIRRPDGRLSVNIVEQSIGCGHATHVYISAPWLDGLSNNMTQDELLVGGEKICR